MGLLLKKLKEALFGSTDEKSSNEAYALIVLEDTDMVRHYRWVCLSDFKKALRKNKVVADEPVVVSQISWLQRCVVTGYDYNLFVVHMKNGKYYRLKSKTTLGDLLKNSQQVFEKDGNINWSKIRVVSFLPVGKKIYFDHKGYELAQENNHLVVRRYYPK